MKAPELITENGHVRLIKPVVERDAPLGVQWLQGAIGHETLSLMGVKPQDITDSSLVKERKRVQSFIDKTDQLNWMIDLDGKVVGSIWADMTATEYLPAPAIHLMIGDTNARGQGVGTASMQAVVQYLHERGFARIHSRHLVKNNGAAELLHRIGFANEGARYNDLDGLQWQNVVMQLSLT